MKRLEPVDRSGNANNNNGNSAANGDGLHQKIFRNIAETFRIKSIEIVDNNDYLYDDLRNTTLAPDDDDVFIDKEKGLSYVADHFSLSPGPATKETTYTFEKVEDRHEYNDLVEVRESKVETFYHR